MNILPMKTRQRRLIILSFCGHVMLACTALKSTSTEPSSAMIKDASVRAEKSDLIVPPKDCVVGELIKNERFSARRPDGYCIEDNFYRGANFRLGRLNVFGLQEPPKIDMGTHTMLSAALRPNLFKRLQREGSCPSREPMMAQFRSDWYAAEGGYDTSSQARLSEAHYLDTTGAARTLDIIETKPSTAHPQVDDEGEPASVEIRIRNPFVRPLTGLKLTLHYEGGGGKPMPKYIQKSVQLRGGESKLFTTPLELYAGQPARHGRSFRFVRAHLSGVSGGCLFLSNLGPMTP